MTYTVEKNVPLLPKANRRPKGEFRQALESMDVGDSVLVSDKSSKNISSICCCIADQLGYKYTHRTDGDNFRVWRVS
jgi:hypothetical protein